MHNKHKKESKHSETTNKQKECKPRDREREDDKVEP
jgi:hypothetical protein